MPFWILLTSLSVVHSVSIVIARRRDPVPGAAAAGGIGVALGAIHLTMGLTHAAVPRLFELYSAIVAGAVAMVVLDHANDAEDGAPRAFWLALWAAALVTLAAAVLRAAAVL